MQISDFVISGNKDILECLKKLNELRDLSSLILFVEEDQKIIGSITDGDIRRSLINQNDLTLKVKDICNKNFRFIREAETFTDLQQYRNSRKNINILPVLNNQDELVDVLDLIKLYAKLPLECMLMAGGRGKRLSPLTDSIPKPMLDLGGIPILEWNINHLMKFGIEKFYISLKYRGQQIVDYFGDGSSKGIQIEYIWEDEPMGTAGALTLVDTFNSKNILLMNSDLFTNVDIESMFKSLLEENASMVIASTEYRVDIPYAIFELNQNKEIKAFKEKPSYNFHSNAGIYIFSKELIDKIPRNTFFDITDLMDILVEENHKILHEPIQGYWVDIGKPDDYIRAQGLVKHVNL